jgi:class 3 adenylate cyclase
MESHGTRGRIQITRATYELLADEFECEPRGTIAVKGKGEVEVWYLIRPRGDRLSAANDAVGFGPIRSAPRLPRISD